MSISISIDQIRKSNLKNFIANNGYKSLTEFAKKNGFFASNLSPILNGDKKFTDKLARTLEEKLMLPVGFLSRLTTEQENEYIVSFKTIDKTAKSNHAIVDQGTFLGIEKNIVEEDGLDPQNLFAIGKEFEVDRNALIETIQQDSVLVFNTSDFQLKNKKIYLIQFSNQLLLRRYNGGQTGFLETDNDKLYARISAPSKDITVIGRLVYQLNLARF